MTNTASLVSIDVAKAILLIDVATGIPRPPPGHGLVLPEMQKNNNDDGI